VLVRNRFIYQTIYETNDVCLLTQNEMANLMRNIFIETSISIERILGRIARREHIRTTLEDAKVSTSSYIWMEFRRTALQAIAYLLTIIRQMRQEGETYIRFSELMKRVATGTAISYSQRILQNCA